MKGRILCKLSSEAAKRKRQRRKDIKAEVDDLVSTFIAATEVPITASGTRDRMMEDEQSDEDSWTNLPTLANHGRVHVREIPTQAYRKHPGSLVKTRADALKAATLHG